MKQLYKTVFNEFKDLTRTELACLIFVFILITFNALFLNDCKLAVISAVCGILYTVFAGKGKLYCYIFGLAGTCIYAYLAFINTLYGNCLLYLCYYLPMQILGIIHWKKHLKKESLEIYKTGLPTKDYLKLFLTSFLMCLTACTILFILKDNHPVLDGCATALSIIGMYLTVKRAIEQWYVWGVVNLLSLTMWILVIIQGQKTYSTALMWGTYLFLSFYFYKKWKKEIE